MNEHVNMSAINSVGTRNREAFRLKKNRPCVAFRFTNFPADRLTYPFTSRAQKSGAKFCSLSRVFGGDGKMNAYVNTSATNFRGARNRELVLLE